MADHRDIAVAVLGATIALASVLVVFIGFLVAHAEALPAETPNKIKQGYIRAARWGLLPTSVSILEALLCYAWLFSSSDFLLYVWAGGFAVVALTFLTYAIVATWMI